ncbi:DUF4301 family protein [Flavobacteriaceae bacterium]|nr:DUF4301 family protein [Flavobacteriaceae bacterium]
MNYSSSDVKQVENLGLSLIDIEKQLEYYQSPPSFVNLKSSATIGNGIIKLSDSELLNLITYYEQHNTSLSVVKFTPASGAASRMFKVLHQFLDDYDPVSESINSYINKNKITELFLFFVTVEKLPFHDDTVMKMRAMVSDYDLLSLDQRRLLFVRTLLDKAHLNYTNRPKGLLPFHKYKNHISTAFEEHLFEAAQYASVNGKAVLHFTITKAHLEQFQTKLKSIQKLIESKTKTKFEITFSNQASNTNVLAVDLKNQPFRLNNKLFFRPSGHGALIKNLNQIDADIIFIKNVDNVVVNKYMEDVVRYKKVLAGVLLKTQHQLFLHAKTLEADDLPENKLKEIATFLTQKLNIVINPQFEKYAIRYQIQFLKSKINRPIRVCGMVKNESEPGGGPFWVKNENDEISLQIVEASQVNTGLKSQKAILTNATHFNPVDIVCGVKNHKGESYDLEQFVDLSTYFVTTKTKYNHKLKTLEKPGLWNGSMADWNTIFVEVPIITFNPVKTVNDLLKFTHQVK